MSISVFPAPSTAAGPDAKVFELAEAYEVYEINDTFLAGGYTITTSPANSQINITFSNATDVLLETITTSGTVSFSIGQDATQVYLQSRSNIANTTVTITYTAENVSGAIISGTLDTVTTTSTYNQTGFLFPVVVSGGGAGGGSDPSNRGGSGGGGGGIAGKLVYTNTATSITIGSGGVGRTNTIDGGSGNPGGASSFGNLISVNGGTGGYGGSNSTTPAGTSNTFGSSSAVGGSGTNEFGPGNQGGANVDVFPSLSLGTNGGGGGGGQRTSGGNGNGSGIGTGGIGAGQNNDATSGTGYGAGGGAAGYSNINTTNSRYTGSGTQGVVYVLRGF